MRTSSLPYVPLLTAVALPLFLTFTHSWPLVTSVPLFWLWFILAALVYPSYILYFIQPLSPPSLIRSVLILVPLVLLSLLAFPFRRVEGWGFELTHLVVGAVVFSFKKAPEVAAGWVEPSVTRNGWGRWILHWLTPATVVYEEEQREKQTPPPPSRTSFSLPSVLDPHLQSLSPADCTAAFRQVRLKAVVHCVWMAVHMTAGALVGLVSLWLVYHDSAVLQWSIARNLLSSVMILEYCSALFPLVKALAEFLHGDGIYIGDMFEGVLHSTSISTFWRRWNRGMRDVFYHAVYRPLGGKKHALLSTVAVGLFSGSLHEFEVRLWTGHSSHAMLTFFVLQVTAIGVERIWGKWAIAHQWRKMGPVMGWGLTALWLSWSSQFFLRDFGLDFEQMAGKAVFPGVRALGWEWREFESTLRHLGGVGHGGHHDVTLA